MALKGLKTFGIYKILYLSDGRRSVVQREYCIFFLFRKRNYFNIIFLIQEMFLVARKTFYNICQPKTASVRY